MMEAERTSKTLLKFYQNTRRYNPEDSHLRTHRREGLKSYLVTLVSSIDDVDEDYYPYFLLLRSTIDVSTYNTPVQYDEHVSSNYAHYSCEWLPRHTTAQSSGLVGAVSL
jgi:hypothetical protein